MAEGGRLIGGWVDEISEWLKGQDPSSCSLCDQLGTWLITDRSSEIAEQYRLCTDHLKADGRPVACGHVIPLHDGWTVEQTIGWIGQGLVLPDVDPPSWAAVVSLGGSCELCAAEWVDG